MNSRQFGAALAVVGLVPAAAWACPDCSAASTCCLPGFGLTGFHVGLALPVLAALLERPFYTRAGVRRLALAYALQANLLSALMIGMAGLFVMGAAWPSGDALLLAWMPASVLLASLVEHAWVNKPWRGARAVRWRWVLLGNVVSAAVIMALPLLHSVFGTDSSRHIARIYPMRDTIALCTLAVCAGVYLVAFLVTRGAGVGEDDGRRGFEVVATGREAGDPPAARREPM